MSNLILFPFLVLLLLNFILAEHILFFHSIASYSHRVATYPLADALAKRGHHVTYISPFYSKKYQYVNPNITEVVPEELAKTIDTFINSDFDINMRVQKQFPRLVFQFYEAGIEACKNVFTSPEVQKHFEQNPKLDLIIIDNCMADCAAALAYKYGAKHIFFNTVIFIGNEHDTFGFAPESGAIPELEINPPQTPFTFFERVFNTLISIHFRYEHYKFVSTLDELSRKYLNVSDMPFLDDVVRNASLVLYTGDLVTDYPRSTPPLVVNVGGMLCHDQDNITAKPLPKELEDFINQNSDSSDGFIYISFGSMVICPELPKNIINVFFDTIEAFPKMKFLWKWSGQMPEKRPKNLFVSHWFPQKKILGHPMIRAFITQGGRPSTSESLCNGVPMIAFPILGDQDVNSNRMNKMGANVILELGTVTHEQLQNAISKVAYDKRMKERMLELQKIVFDRPMSAIDTAVWWTEYVLRTKDTSHLRGSTFDQTWWERRLLDVWAFFFSIILSIFVVLIMASVIVFKFIRHTSVKQLKAGGNRKKKQ